MTAIPVHRTTRRISKLVGAFVAAAFCTTIGSSILSRPAAAQETTAELYAEFRYSYNYADPLESWVTANNASRLGVRGSVTERGLSAFFDLQTGASVDRESGVALAQRHHLAGVRGPLGSVTIGRQTTPYKAVGVRLDPFYDSSTLDVAGQGPSGSLFAGGSYGLSPLNNGFADATAIYTSPAFAGLSLNAGISVAPEEDDDFGIGLTFRRAGIELGVQHHDPASSEVWAQAAGIERADRGHLAYAWGAASLAGVSYERVEMTDGNGRDHVYLGGRVEVIPRVVLAASLGHVADDEPDLFPAGTAAHGGVFVTLLDGVQVRALASSLWSESGDDPYVLGLGFIYRFGLVSAGDPD